MSQKQMQLSGVSATLLDISFHLSDFGSPMTFMDFQKRPDGHRILATLHDSTLRRPLAFSIDLLRKASLVDRKLSSVVELLRAPRTLQQKSMIPHWKSHFKLQKASVMKIDWIDVHQTWLIMSLKNSRICWMSYPSTFGLPTKVTSKTI